MRCILVTLLLSIFCSTQAASQPTFEDAIADFQSAAGAGDFRAALDAGEKALALADNAGIDQTTLKVLNYNVVSVALEVDPERAIAPAEQLAELITSSGDLEGVPTAEIMVLADAARALANPRSDRLRKPLFDAVEAQDAVRESPRTVSTLLLRVAADALAADHEKSVDRAGQLITSALEGDNAAEYRPYVVRAYIYRVVSRVTDNLKQRSRRERLGDAYVMLDHVRTLYPSQLSIESFDKNLATVEAYRIATASLIEFFEMDLPSDEYSFEGKSLAAEKPPLLINTKDCAELVWLEREPPEMTSKMMEGSWGGAVLLGFSLSETGAVQDARVLAEVPAERFSKASLEASKNWKADVSAVTEDCRASMTTSIQYVIGF